VARYGIHSLWFLSCLRSSLTFPGGVGTVDPGGSDYALADDLTTIQISGSGTFGGGVPPTGGGTWATSGPSGTAQASSCSCQLDEVTLKFASQKSAEEKEGRKYSQMACTCVVIRSLTTAAINKDGTRGSSSCARRLFSTRGRIHFRRLLLVQPNSSCIRAADHTYYANGRVG
jgi:hypothetical protein